MNSLFQYIICFFLSGLSTTMCFAQSDFDDQSTKSFLDRGSDYVGTLGNHDIGMFIGNNGKDELKGHYFYRSDLKDKRFLGQILSTIDIILYEVDSLFDTIGVLRLQAEKSRPSVGLIIGSYTKNNGLVDSVHLEITGNQAGGREDRYNENFEVKILIFYYALLAGDKETVAKYINFPLHVYTSPGKGFVIKNKKQFLKKFDTVFTKEKLDLLRKHVPHDLWVGSQGVEMGGVWFDFNGKVISVVY